MAQLFANAARGLLQSGIISTDTTLTLSAGGSTFPVANGTDWFKAVLQDQTGIEVVYVTAHTSGSSTFTVTRGQDGTTARTFGSGSVLGLRVLASDLSGMATKTGAEDLTNKNITALALKETRVALSANDIDLSTGNYFTKTISGATTLTVSNVPATGTAASFILDLTNGGSATITWWTGVKWAGGTAPTLTAAGRDVLGFFTHDGGTTWTGLVLGKDVK